MGSSVKVSVIVPCHEAGGTIGACLDALHGQRIDRQGFEVHLIDSGDDGAEAAVVERLESWEGRLHYHRAERRGPAAQRNQGVAAARGAYLAFTDADCVPEPGWLGAGLAELERGATLVQGPTLPPPGETSHPHAHSITVTGPSALYPSCNVMYEADALREAGGFPNDLYERHGEHFGEDCELAWRVLRRGGRAAFAPGAVVRHAVFEPDFRAHLRYQWKARLFPYLVREVPELRRDALALGLFLGPRSVESLAALAALALTRRRPLASLLAAPYLGSLLRRLPAEQGSAATLAAEAGKNVLADAVREAGLIWGSIRFRSPVL